MAGTKPVGDPLGERFLCSDVPTKKLCLLTLLPGCSMTLKPGPGIPSEPDERALLHVGNDTHLVHGPNELKGCVSISTEAQALEYLRFFSSFTTAHLFQDEMLEIYPSSGKGCFRVCLPKDRWSSLKLQGPLIKKMDAGFRVTRLAIKPIPNHRDVPDHSQRGGARGR